MSENNQYKRDKAIAGSIPSSVLKAGAEAKAVEAHEQDTLTDEPPEESASENTVYVVVANYDGDPHPHVEGVFSEREAANELRKRCSDVARPPHPIAWSVIEERVDGPT